MRPHLQTLHVDHESVDEASAPLRIQGLFELRQYLQVLLLTGSTQPVEFLPA